MALNIVGKMGAVSAAGIVVGLVIATVIDPVTDEGTAFLIFLGVVLTNLVYGIWKAVRRVKE